MASKVAPLTKIQGFSLIELVAVLVLLGILSAAAFSRFSSSSSLELQSGRDQVVAALHSAQQLAIAQRSRVRFLADNSEISVLVDANDDTAFAGSEAVTVDGTTYPYTLPSGQSIGSGNFDFDRLGRTTAGSLTLTQNSASVVINVNSAGFVK